MSSEMTVKISADVEEFCASMKRATEAMREFKKAIRAAIPWTMRLRWLVQDWFQFLKNNRGLVDKPEHFSQPDAIALPTAPPVPEIRVSIDPLYPQPGRRLL